MSGYVIAGYLITTLVIVSYASWTTWRTRRLERAMYVDIRDETQR